MLLLPFSKNYHDCFLVTTAPENYLFDHIIMIRNRYLRLDSDIKKQLAEICTEIGLFIDFFSFNKQKM